MVGHLYYFFKVCLQGGVLRSGVQVGDTGSVQGWAERASWWGTSTALG